MATISCTNCGAEGESNFSTNYFGELVCELCGTQSYLQNRTETQDAEDMGLDLIAIQKMKRRTKRKKRERKVKVVELTKPVQLLDCIVATQYILHEQAEALVAAVGFPPEYPRVVKQVWFHFLELWQTKGARPFLRCFTEFHYTRRAEDKAMDPAVTNEVLEQWDAENARDLERLFQPSAPAIPEEEQEEGGGNGNHDDHNQEEEGNVMTAVESASSVSARSNQKRSRPHRKRRDTLDWFVLPDLVGMLVLAGRMLNIGALPCDYAHWIKRGDLPYHNLLSRCPMEIQEPVERVAVFFDATIRANWISTSRISYRAHYLQFHLEMRVPPLNASLIAFTICENLNLPAKVFQNFQWITAQLNIPGKLSEKPVQQSPYKRVPGSSALDCGPGIAAYLLAAIRLCPNWMDWIYERVLRRDHHVPPCTNDAADCMPRHELGAFVDFCEQTLLGNDSGTIPDDFVAHVEELKGRLSTSNTHLFGRLYSSHPLRAYPADHENGICVETPEEIDTRVGQIKQQQQQDTVVPDADGHALKEPQVEEEHPLDPEYFYPIYSARERQRFHAPFEAALELVSEYIDAPMGVVMKWVDVIDKDMRQLTVSMFNDATGHTDLYAAVKEIRKNLASKRQQQNEKEEDEQEEEEETKEQEEKEQENEEDLEGKEEIEEEKMELTIAVVNEEDEDLVE